MDQKELFHGAKQFLKSNKVKAYFEKQQTVVTVCRGYPVIVSYRMQNHSRDCHPHCCVPTLLLSLIYLVKLNSQEKIEALKKEHEELIKYVSESIDRCKPETRSKLRPMLKVEFVASLLQSIVAECKHKGVDPTERLSSPELMDQITQVQEIQNSEDSVRAMDKLGKVCKNGTNVLNDAIIRVLESRFEKILSVVRRDIPMP